MVDPWIVESGSGRVSIELYDPGTFDSEPIRIQTPDGPKVPYVTDPADADTGMRVYTGSNGVQGINTVGILIIDDFEDGNDNEWTIQGSGSQTVPSPGLNGTGNRWRHDQFTEAHLQGADAVNRGPQPGDVFEFWFRVGNTTGPVINRFEFAASGLNEDNVYRVEFENGTGADEFSLEKIQNGGQALVDTDPGFTAASGQEYRCEIGWNVNGNDITAQLFLPNGNAATSQLLINDSSSGDYAQPGIFIRTNDNNVCSWDEIRILPN